MSPAGPAAAGAGSGSPVTSCQRRLKWSAMSATAGPSMRVATSCQPTAARAGWMGGVEPVAGFGGQVDPADERDPVVDHDRLLVVAMERALVAVERDLHLRVPREAVAHCARRPSARVGRVAAARRPRRARGRRRAPRAPRGGRGGRRARPSRTSANDGREVPAGKVDVRAGAEQFLGHRRQGLGAVDQARRPIAAGGGGLVAAQPPPGASSARCQPIRRRRRRWWAQICWLSWCRTSTRPGRSRPRPRRDQGARVGWSGISNGVSLGDACVTAVWRDSGEAASDRRLGKRRSRPPAIRGTAGCSSARLRRREAPRMPTSDRVMPSRLDLFLPRSWGWIGHRQAVTCHGVAASTRAIAAAGCLDRSCRRLSGAAGSALGHLGRDAEAEQAAAESDPAEHEPGPAEREPADHVAEPVEVEKHPARRDGHGDPDGGSGQKSAGGAWATPAEQQRCGRLESGGGRRVAARERRAERAAAGLKRGPRPVDEFLIRVAMSSSPPTTATMNGTSQRFGVRYEFDGGEQDAQPDTTVIDPSCVIVSERASRTAWRGGTPNVRRRCRSRSGRVRADEVGEQPEHHACPDDEEQRQRQPEAGLRLRIESCGERALEPRVSPRGLPDASRPLRSPE